MPDIAKRVSALLTEKWLWNCMAGAMYDRGDGVRHRVPDVARDAESVDEHVAAWSLPTGPIVSLADPATQGCLLALLRARGDGTLTTMKGASYASHFTLQPGRGAKGMEWRAATPGEAIGRAFLTVYGDGDE